MTRSWKHTQRMWTAVWGSQGETNVTPSYPERFKVQRSAKHERERDNRRGLFHTKREFSSGVSLIKLHAESSLKPYSTRATKLVLKKATYANKRHGCTQFPFPVSPTIPGNVIGWVWIASRLRDAHILPQTIDSKWWPRLKSRCLWVRGRHGKINQHLPIELYRDRTA